MKKIPQRTCIGCNSKKDKKDLIRVVKNKDGKISMDLTGKKDGRGIYVTFIWFGDLAKICLPHKINKAIKNKRISRTFEMEIEKSIYENLRNYINGGEIIG